MDWRRLFVVAFAAVVLFSCPGWAVKMDAVVGFGGLVGGQLWTPVSITLENDTGADLKGTLEFAQQASGGYDSPRAISSCSPDINLPAGARKKYQAYIVPEEYGDVLRISLLSGYRVVAQIKPKITTILSRYRGINECSIVTVGSADKRLAFLANTAFSGSTTKTPPGMPGMRGGSSTEITIGWIEQQNLPDRPAGYMPVEILILSDFSVSSASPEVLNAIKAWVAGGGTLVVPSGADYKKLQEPGFYGELLPVNILGAGQASGIRKLEAMCKAPALGPIALTKAAEIPGRCSYSERDSSGILWAVRKYGTGRVVFLAFDPGAQPFRNWQGQTSFWKMLVSMPQIYPLYAVDSLFKPNDLPGNRSLNISKLVSMNPAIDLPPAYIIWVFLVVYIVILVPVNYFVLRAKKRLEMAWITVPVVVLVFTLGAYGIGYSVKGGQILFNQASVLVTSSGARMAAVKTVGCLFSPSRRGYQIELDDSSAVGNTGSDEYDNYYGYPDRETEATKAVMDEKLVWDNVKMSMWSSQYMMSLSGCDLGGAVVGNVLASKGTVSGTISNNTRYDLKNCNIIGIGATKNIDNIPAGKTLQFSVAIPVLKKMKTPTGNILPPAMPMGFPGSPNSKAAKQGTGNLSAKLISNVNSNVQRDGIYLTANIEAGTDFTVLGKAPKEQSASCIVIRLSE